MLAIVYFISIVLMLDFYTVMYNYINDKEEIKNFISSLFIILIITFLPIFNTIGAFSSLVLFIINSGYRKMYKKYSFLFNEF